MWGLVAEEEVGAEVSKRAQEEEPQARTTGLVRASLEEPDSPTTTQPRIPPSGFLVPVDAGSSNTSLDELPSSATTYAGAVQSSTGAFGCKGSHEWVGIVQKIDMFGYKAHEWFEPKKRICHEDAEPFHPIKSVESNGHPLHA